MTVRNWTGLTAESVALKADGERDELCRGSPQGVPAWCRSRVDLAESGSIPLGEIFVFFV